MPNFQVVEALLVAEKGKRPQVQRRRKSYQLEVTDNMYESVKSHVTIYKCMENSLVRMAFCFPYKTSSYVMKVVGDAVKLEENKGIEEMPTDESKLFHMEGTMHGTWNLVESVAQSGKYLCIRDKKITLSSNPAHCARFRLDEEHEREA